MPSHRNGVTPIEHTNHQSTYLVPVQGGVNGQGQMVALPPGQKPAQQGSEAKGYFYLGVTRSGLVWAAVKPLPQVLAQTVPESQAYQGGDHRVLTGAVREDRPIDPPGQTSLLGWSEVGKLLGNSLVHLVPFTRKAHESPPHIPVLCYF